MKADHMAKMVDTIWSKMWKLILKATDELLDRKLPEKIIIHKTV